MKLPFVVCVLLLAYTAHCVTFQWGTNPSNDAEHGACSLSEPCAASTASSSAGQNVIIDVDEQNSSPPAPRIFYELVRITPHPDSSFGHDEVRLAIDYGPTPLKASAACNERSSELPSSRLDPTSVTEIVLVDSATVASQGDISTNSSLNLGVPSCSAVDLTTEGADPQPLSSQDPKPASFLTWKRGAKPLDTRVLTKKSRASIKETRFEKRKQSQGSTSQCTINNATTLKSPATVATVAEPDLPPRPRRPGKELATEQDSTPSPGVDIKETETEETGIIEKTVAKEKRKSSVDDSFTERSLKLHKTEETRKFLPQWTTGRDWLVFDESTSTMKCSLCIENGFDNAFTRGCASIRVIRIMEHERPITGQGKMSDHAFAEQCSKRDQEQFRLAQNNAIVSQKTGTLNAMHQAYILAKQDIALANFPEMIAGVEGFYITDDLQAKLNIGSEEYRNHVMCQEFVISLLG
ncbi:hypothetical protein CYMTET_8471 [Cymbomonas tetramitiformis]|uniref:Uncharacterized protein n=1 Tax=Cymbomonas tetramitiformis TaxID=36881 RepID=A0AAE0LFY6_9CHLO|nr:hypothetical protein CYMTET_8471 [Cymbomonas tetramitiformis]